MARAIDASSVRSAPFNISVDDPNAEQQMQAITNPATRAYILKRSKGDPRLPPPEPTSVPAQALPDDPPSMLSRGLRQTGLTLRDFVQGISALPATAVEMMQSGATTFLPDSPPSPASEISGVLTKAGVPQPQGKTESIIHGAIEGGIAGMTPGGISKALGAPTTIGELALQGGRVGATAGGAQQIALQSGVDPATAGLLGLGAGIGTTGTGAAVGTALSGTGRALKSALQPLTASGRSDLVGNLLLENAADPQAALRNMQNAQTLVPGSLPSAAQAAGDVGLASLEKGVRRSSPYAGGMFSEREQATNAARNAMLDSIAQDEAAIASAKTARDTTALPMLQAAKDRGAKVVTMPVWDVTKEIMQSGAGRRDAVSQAVEVIQKKLIGAKDIEQLYGVRQAIGDMLSGKLQGEAGNVRLASAQLIKIRDAIDTQMVKAAPEFGDYLKSYREQSAPINQMETGQDIRGRVMNPAPDLGGNPVMSQTKWTNVVGKNRDTLAKTMTGDQMIRLDAIGRDLDRGVQTTKAAAISPSEMDGMNGANILGSVVRGAQLPGVASILAKPLAFLYKIPERQLNELTVKAMLDPETASLLMSKATPRNVESLGTKFKQLLSSGVSASALAVQ